MTEEPNDRAEERSPNQEDSTLLDRGIAAPQSRDSQNPKTQKNASRYKIAPERRSAIAQSASIAAHRPDLADFYDAKDALDDFHRAEAAYERQKAEQATWEDKEDVSLYYSLLSMKHRTKLLDILVPTRRCILCTRFFELSKSWVVLGITKRTSWQGSRNKLAASMSVNDLRNRLAGKLESNLVCAICKSCYTTRMHHKNHKSNDKYNMQRHIMEVVRQRTVADTNAAIANEGRGMIEEIRETDIVKQERRYRLNVSLLEGFRERLGISSKEFAIHMGWSTAYQSKLENGDVETVTEEVWRKIRALYEKHGAKFI